MWLFHEHGDVLSLIVYVNPTQVHAVASGGESAQEQEDAEEDDGGLSARVSALSLGEEEDEGARSLPRRLYLVQRDTAVDVRAGAAGASAAENSTIAAGGRDEDPWATVGGLERAIQEVVGCVEQASCCGMVVWCDVGSRARRSHFITRTRSQPNFLFVSPQALEAPQMFVQYGLKPTRGVLLVGPSGSGKTMLLR